MSKREINLIGGFYKDSALPWSSQDTVNWLPVASDAGGTRSPMKLRGAPGLRTLGESVQPLFSDLSLVTNLVAYRNLPPDFVTGSPSLLPIAPAPGGNSASVSRRGVIVWVDNVTFDRTIQCIAYNPETPATPWASFTPPDSSLRTWVSLAWAPNSALLQVSEFGSPWRVRLFRLSGTSWAELTNTGPALTQGFRGVVWSDDSTRFVGVQSTGSSRYQVYDVFGDTFFRSATDTTPNPQINDRQNQASFPVGQKNYLIFINESASFGVCVVHLTSPNVTHVQQLPLPSGASSGPAICKPLSTNSILAGWTFGTTRLHLYSWNGTSAAYVGPAPWQPPSEGSYVLSKDRRFLAFFPLGGNSSSTIVVSTETWTPVAIPTATVPGFVDWFEWAN